MKKRKSNMVCSGEKKDFLRISFKKGVAMGRVEALFNKTITICIQVYSANWVWLDLAAEFSMDKHRVVIDTSSDIGQFFSKVFVQMLAKDIGVSNFTTNRIKGT